MWKQILEFLWEVYIGACIMIETFWMQLNTALFNQWRISLSSTVCNSVLEVCTLKFALFLELFALLKLFYISLHFLNQDIIATSTLRCQIIIMIVYHSWHPRRLDLRNPENQLFLISCHWKDLHLSKYFSFFSLSPRRVSWTSVQYLSD